MDEHKTFTLPAAGLLGLTVVIATVFVRGDAPYFATRPPQYADVFYEAAAAQRVDARLWQDPFAAVDAFERKESQALAFDAKLRNVSGLSDARFGVSMGSLRAREQVLLDRSPTPDKSALRVMAIMIGGGSGVGSEEQRRRERYAAVSALGAADYRPTDDEHIGYVVFDSCHPPARDPLQPNPDPQIEALTWNCGDTDVESAATRPKHPSLIRVPFEFFQHSDPTPTPPGYSFQGPRSVLILWIDDTMLVNQDDKKQGWLANLKTLLRALAPCSNETPECELRLIGPSTSEIVESLAPRPTDLDLAAMTALSPAGELRRPLLLSPYATASFVHDKFVAWKEYVAFHSVVPYDTDVLPKVLQELKDRGAVLCGAKAQGRSIVLFQEWDTTYGRYSRAALSKSLKEFCGPEDTVELVPYLFIRGLDGALPVVAPDAGALRESPRLGTSAKQIEWPETRDQRDYLRRTGERIMREVGDAKKIIAVGIMASDTHDKLLLLQALRDRFPEKMFFTTDLDVRLLHPTVRKWTRNLLTASGYNLSLPRPLQRRTPTFRDTYQTSVYLATLWSLEPAQDGVERAGMNAECWAQGPGVWEVGRVRFVRWDDSLEKECPIPRQLLQNESDIRAAKADLQVCRGGPNTRPVTDGIASSCLRGADDAAERSWGGGMRTVFVGLVAMASLTLFLYARHVPLTGRSNKFDPVATQVEIPERPKRFRRTVESILMVAIVVLLAATNGLALWVTLDPHEAQGVGATAVALCWAFALSLTWIFFYRIYASMIPRFRAIERVMFSGPYQRREPSLHDSRRWTMEWLTDELWRDQKADWGSVEGTFKEAWDAYQYHTFSKWRLIRVAFWWAIIILPLTLLTEWLPFPEFPIHGEFMRHTLRALAVGSLLSLTLLLAMIADIVFLCSLFVITIGRHQNEYPKPTTETYIERFKIRPAIRGNIDALLDTDAIGRRTEMVAVNLYYPFIVMTVFSVGMFVSDEHWAKWPGRLITLGWSVVVVSALWIVLRWCVERARRVTVAELKDAEVAICGESSLTTDERAASQQQCQLLQQMIETERRGAYAAVQDQAIVRAILLPLGGGVAVQLIEYVMDLVK
jgi:hypothetical protein